METFEEIAGEFEERVRSTVWCTLTTVDAAGRPRSRIVHPVWEVLDGAPVGWIGSRPNLKLHHIDANPAVSLMYWDPRHQQVTIDGTASAHHDDSTKRALWQRFSSFDEPYGFDPSPIWPDGPAGDRFVAIRVVPTRIALFGMPPRVWRA